MITSLIKLAMFYYVVIIKQSSRYYIKLYENRIVNSLSVNLLIKCLLSTSKHKRLQLNLKHFYKHFI